MKTQQPKTSETTFLLLSYIGVITFAVLCLCCSCNTLKKQQLKAEKFYYAHPEKLAAKAEQMFPNINEGVTAGRVDTVRDIVRLQGEPGIQGLPGTPGTVRIIQTHSTDTLRVESGVKVAQLKQQLDVIQEDFKKITTDFSKLQKDHNTLQLELKDITHSRDGWRIKFFGLAALIACFFGFKIFMKRF
ncbi:MAG: hypothetical protein ABIN67_13835 [Ferruginibacter sp.]